MTDTIYDDRAAAYVGARERLKAADRVKVDHHRAVEAGRTEPDELPVHYWSLIAEADVLAQLARCDAQVGLLAGGYLVDQGQRIEKNRDHARLVAEAAAQRHPVRAAADAFVAGRPSPILRAGARVSVTCGDWAGRVGTITMLHLGNNPPLVDVSLDPPCPTPLAEDRLTINVRLADVVLIGSDR